MKKTLFLILICLVTRTTFAQMDIAFNPPRGWELDSVTLLVYHMHTQSPTDDSINSVRMLISKYLYVQNDVLYAKFPQQYHVYPMANMETGENDLVEKPMIIIKKDGMTKYFYTHELLGKKVKIINLLEPATVILSL